MNLKSHLEFAISQDRLVLPDRKSLTVICRKLQDKYSSVMWRDHVITMKILHVPSTERSYLRLNRAVHKPRDARQIMIHAKPCLHWLIYSQDGRPH